ncbi:MAG: sodium/proton-translocating pyrophosphatase, partial [Halieaceae bacterium]|nr:sodium/proton-translocating pyrophosphatase [Halieaceae bacterium]
GKSAMSMIEEVRRQFREKPGILKGEDKPDYAACVAISTADAQRQMILPSVLVVAIPMIVGAIFGPAAVMGLLTGGLVCGFLMAIMMANAGGAWDNAKKAIEAGKLEGSRKGGDAHAAAVIGDTVGDPFKDTSGPAMNILVKLLSIVSLILVPFIT